MTSGRNSLPHGWSWSTFSTVASIASNLVPPKEHASKPHIAPDNIERDTGKLLPFRTIGEDAVKSPKHLFKPGQLLYSKIRPYLNKCVRISFEGLCSADMYPLDPHIDAAFLHYYILSQEFVRAVSDAAGSRTVLPKTNQEQLAGVPVPVAPLPEQRRIADAIESYFTRIDHAVSTLERVERSLRRHRASILKAAIEGRLVPTADFSAQRQGRNHEPANVLLKRILAERHLRWSEAGKKGHYQEPVAPDTSKLQNLPEGWCWASMDQFLVRIEAGKNFRCEERPPNHDEVGVVKVSAVSWGTFLEDESKTCTREDLVNEDLFIRPNDFLISRANTIELVGACVIVGGVQRKLMLSDKILRLHTVGNLDRWLLWVLRSGFGRKQIEDLSSGNQESMRNIGQDGIARICIPLPPAAEISAILSKIDLQLSKCDQVEQAVLQSLRRCSRLRQSVLRWAFEGRLAKQDVADEPAMALLQRITAGRDVTISQKAPRTRLAAKRQVRA